MSLHARPSTTLTAANAQGKTDIDSVEDS
jgi:hypothetical protein